jgi:hypothetical protein
MMKRLYIVLLIACSISCGRNNEEVDVSPKKGTFYELPQGNAPYDRQILDWYRQYNTYILYRFEEKDYRYGISGFYDYPALVRTADTAALPGLTAFLKSYWFGFYNDAFLKKYLPFKILLAGLMHDEGSSDPVTRLLLGYDYILLPRVDTAFSRLTATERNRLKTALNLLFMQRIFYVSGPSFPRLHEPPEAFFEVSNYQDRYIAAEDQYAAGFLTLDGQSGQTRPPGRSADFMAYLSMIFSNTRQELDRGMLSPATDKKGLVRRKYDILVGFFKDTFQVDIQAIGNKQD